MNVGIIQFIRSLYFWTAFQVICIFKGDETDEKRTGPTWLSDHFCFYRCDLWLFVFQRPSKNRGFGERQGRHTRDHLSYFRRVGFVHRIRKDSILCKGKTLRSEHRSKNHEIQAKNWRYREDRLRQIQSQISGSESVEEVNRAIQKSHPRKIKGNHRHGHLWSVGSIAC